MNRTVLKGTPLKTRSGNDATAAMAYDKQKNGKPMTPVLRATAAKASTKSPLTPRVAGSNVSVATPPLTRRGTRPDSFVQSNQDVATPLSSFLTQNVTPRSGSRKSRVESPTTTPTGTPQGTPAPEVRANHDGAFGGESRRLAPAFSPLSETPTQRQQSQPADDSKFFYASDAKSPSQTAKPPVRPGMPNKQSSSFLYANGTSLPPPHSSSTSAVGSVAGEDRMQPKFFHANGTPDARNATSFFPPTASTVGAPSARLAQGSGTTGPLSQRPVSPVKATPTSIYNNTAYNAQKKAPLPSPGVTRPTMITRQSTTSAITTTNDLSRRRVSIEMPSRPVTHDSLIDAAFDVKSDTRRLSNGPLTLVSMPLSPMSTDSGRLSYQEDDIADDHDKASEAGRPLSTMSTSSDAHNPAKAGGSIEQMNELAAQARRERKVLDLEITNSSLESINRTLERQLRKQTAELRRFRRLSRSGRLSINTATSGGLSSIGEDGEPISDVSEEEEDSESEESDFSDDLDEGALSPGAIAASDLRHRRKDEKRLQLDLTKHQQLLIDSQKMNQSLKRCLGWTEELITEGKKALAYNVKVSDIELGGRVLVADEADDEDDAEITNDGGAAQSPRESLSSTDALQWDREGQTDRDSGVEVEHAKKILTLGETY